MDELLEQRYVGKIVRGSTFLIIDYFIIALLGALFWLVLARMISPDEVGAIATVLALASMVLVPSSLGVPVAASKYLSEFNVQGKLDEVRRVYRISITLILAASIPIAFGLCLFSSLISQNIYDDPLLTLPILIIALTIPFQSVLGVLRGCYNGFQKMKYSAVVDSINSLAKVALTISLIAIGFRVLGVMFGILIGFMASALIGLFFLIPRVLPNAYSSHFAAELSKPTYKEILFFGLPNLVASSRNMIMKQVGILLIGIFLTMPEVAYYNSSLIIIVTISGTLATISTAFLPTVSELWTLAKKKMAAHLYNMCIRFSIFFAGLALMLVFNFSEFIMSLFSPSYIAAASALRILCISTVLFVITRTSVSVLNGIGKPRAVMIISITMMTSSTVLNLFLIPILGIDGASYAFTLGAGAGAVLGSLLIKREAKIELEIEGIIKSTSCIIFSIVVMYLSGKVSGNMSLGFVIGVIVYLAAIFGVKAISKEEVKLVSNAFR